jgi:hypothetical protein
MIVWGGYDGISGLDTGGVYNPSLVASNLKFFTLDPCRVVDTRSAQLGGPSPLVAGVPRVFSIAARCGIPTTARAASVNVAVTQPSAAGNIRIYQADAPPPLTSSINYSAGQTRSNNAVVALGSGDFAVLASQPSGTVHLILDVNGYYE